MGDVRHHEHGMGSARQYSYHRPAPTGSVVEPADVEIDGARLRELRKLMGDDLKSFAARARISFQYVSQLERGTRRRVSPPTFARICDALDIQDRREMMLLPARTRR